MSTDVAVREEPTSEIALTPGQTAFNDKQVAALRQLGMSAAHPADLAVFFHQVQRTGLDPFARQIYMIERKGKQTIQTGIDGFRLIARRATDSRRGTFGYEQTEWCGRDGVWRDVWLDDQPPAAARVTVLRDGERFPAVALFSEYVGRKRDGSVTEMWATKGALMLAKCAEALALRKAFPQDLSGIYTSDEMQAADNPAGPSQGGSSRDRLQAALDQPPVDADVIEPDPITPEQSKHLHALVSYLGLTREQKLQGVSSTLGRPVETTKDLTKDEATKVIRALRDEAQRRADAAAEEHAAGDVPEEPPA